MDHAERINRTLAYIEANLDRDIRLDRLARQCALSEYHFHRIFGALVGESVRRYVEKRRLSRAALALLETEKRIVDIAFDYGFGSHETFSRSFKKSFALTPSQFRKARPAAKLHQESRIGPLDLRLRRGTAQPNPEIQRRSRFKIAGLSYTGRDNTAVYNLWQRLWALAPRVAFLRHAEEHFGACFHDLDMRGRDTFTYVAGAEVGRTSKLPKGMETVAIPASMYAVFPHQGPASRIEDTFDRVYRSWLPSSDYTPTLDLDLLRVDARFHGESDDSIVELWMPVAER